MQQYQEQKSYKYRPIGDIKCFLTGQLRQYCIQCTSFTAMTDVHGLQTDMTRYNVFVYFSEMPSNTIN